MSGKLFYLVGASGSGKDSILKYAKENLDWNNIIIAHRYITRDFSDLNENHIELSEEEILNRKNNDLFLFSWNANGFNYGIGKEVLLWLEAGFDVVINGSREFLANNDLNVISICIQVDNNILQERLTKRKRETTLEIENRMKRTKVLNDLDRYDYVIENNATIESAANELNRIINSNKK